MMMPRTAHAQADLNIPPIYAVMIGLCPFHPASLSFWLPHKKWSHRPKGLCSTVLILMQQITLVMLISTIPKIIGFIHRKKAPFMIWDSGCFLIYPPLSSEVPELLHSRTTDSLPATGNLKDSDVQSRSIPEDTPGNSARFL